MCLDPRKPESGAILAAAGQSAPPRTIAEIREIAEDCVAAATRFEPGTPDFRRAADACAAAYLAGSLEGNAEIGRLRAAAGLAERLRLSADDQFKAAAELERLRDEVARLGGVISRQRAEIDRLLKRGGREE